MRERMVFEVLQSANDDELVEWLAYSVAEYTMRWGYEKMAYVVTNLARDLGSDEALALLSDAQLERMQYAYDMGD